MSGRLSRGGHWIARRECVRLELEGRRSKSWHYQVCTCGWIGRGSMMLVEARQEGRVHVLTHQWDRAPGESA